jgi:phage-related protein
MKKFAIAVAVTTLAAAPHLASAAPALSLTGLPVVGPVLSGVGGLVNGLPVVGPVVKGVLTGGGTGNLLAVGALVPVVLNVALPVVTGLAPTLANLHLPVGNLVPVVLNIALPVVTGLAPTLAQLHLPVGTLVPVVLNIALPLVDKVAPVVAPIISGVGGLAGGLVSGL